MTQESKYLIDVLLFSPCVQQRRAMVQGASYPVLMAAKHILRTRKGCFLSTIAILRIEAELTRRDRTIRTS